MFCPWSPIQLHVQSIFWSTVPTTNKSNFLSLTLNVARADPNTCTQLPPIYSGTMVPIAALTTYTWFTLKCSTNSSLYCCWLSQIPLDHLLTGINISATPAAVEWRHPRWDMPYPLSPPNSDQVYVFPSVESGISAKYKSGSNLSYSAIVSSFQWLISAMLLKWLIQPLTREALC